MNSVNLVGRLVKDPDIRDSKNGTVIARFTLAVNRSGKDAGTDYINCVAFGKTAEFIGNYINKGYLAAISGSISTGSYEKDGQKIYTTEVLVNNYGGFQNLQPKGSQAATKENFNNTFDDTPLAGAEDVDMPW